MSFMSPKIPKPPADENAAADRARAEADRKKLLDEEQAREVAKMGGKRGTQALTTAGFSGYPATLGSGMTMAPSPPARV